MSVAAITLADVAVGLDDRWLIRDLDLDVAEGELFVLVGRSGAGKTTIIKAIAGLVPVSPGRVLFDGLDVTGRPTHERDLGIVFQGRALFGNHDVRANIGFPLRVRKAARTDMAKRVMAEARALRVDHLLDRWPAQLSAGHRQLVQVARALVRRPSVLLMDEPMADVDIETKALLREDIVTLQRGYGVTTVVATNDPVAAMTMADRIGVVSGGRIIQVGTPEQVRAHPTDTHTALLTGSIVLLSGVVEVGSAGAWVNAGSVRLRIWAPALLDRPGDEIVLGLRPHHVVAGSDMTGQISGLSIEDRRHVVRIDVGGTEITSDTITGEVGDAVGLALAGGLVFDPDGALLAVVG